MDFGEDIWFVDTVFAIETLETSAKDQCERCGEQGCA